MDITRENIKMLVSKYGALQNVDELYHLIYYLSQEPPKIFLEIGVYSGGLSAIMKTFFPDLQIIGVDITDPVKPLILPPNTMDNILKLRKNIKEFKIEYITGSSHDPIIQEVVKKVLNGRKADFTFIDAAHDYDSVKKDFEIWSSYSKQVGFHDLHNEIGPYKLWKEIRFSYEFALWKAKDGLGIGVVKM